MYRDLTVWEKMGSKDWPYTLPSWSIDRNVDSQPGGEDTVGKKRGHVQ